MFSAPVFEGKLCKPDELAARVAALPRLLVFTNGCFDVLHRGHVTYLAQARALGAALVVGVNSDDSVKRLKGANRPFVPEFDRLEGLAALGSGELIFEPSGMHGGVYELDVGSAGSAILVLQTVLPPLIMADEPSVLVLTGGTHNPFAPPFDFLLASYLPLLKRMGIEVRLSLERHGFHPRGGGRLRAEVTPGLLGRLELEDRGELHWRRAVATIADLPRHVAERELATLEKRLGLAVADQRAEVLPPGSGPGNVCRVELQHEHVTLVFTEFGKKGLLAETVAGVPIPRQPSAPALLALASVSAPVCSAVMKYQ